eukprot:8764361-Pyramimonas_sp.AAC.1
MSRSSEVPSQDAWHRSHARFLGPCGTISIVICMNWWIWCSAVIRRSGGSAQWIRVMLMGPCSVVLVDPCSAWAGGSGGPLAHRAAICAARSLIFWRSAAALSSECSVLDLLGPVCPDPDPGVWSSMPSVSRVPLSSPSADAA